MKPMDHPRVSICVPLYNAAPFLAETIERLLGQTYRNFELVISDNCSTDASFEIASKYAATDSRIRLARSRCNLGYAGNLDKATSLARGDLILVHCADDTAEPTALERMVEVFRRQDVNFARSIVIADAYIMQGDGTRTHVITRSPPSFGNHEVLCDQYRTSPALDRFRGLRALADVMPRLKTVGWLGAIMYSRALYDAVEGVRNGKLHNPDKHYMYKLLSQDPEVIWIHEPLFSWRLHGQNQTALERAQGAIKQSLDDYVYTFEYSAADLTSWGVDRRAMVRSFVDRSCLRKALSEIAYGSRMLAWRYVCFALATYPGVAVRNAKFWVAAAGVLTGPLGTLAARAGYSRGVWRGDAA